MSTQANTPLGTFTHHPNSILNPDSVTQWAEEEPQHVDDRLCRARALLPNVKKYGSSEYPRAQKAIELWELAIARAEGRAE